MELFSLEFLIFVSISFLVYWFITDKYRWIILLISNIVFSLSKGYECFVSLLIITIFSYCFGLLINKNKKRKILLFVGVGLIILYLSIYKYSSLAMPLGISFYSFEAISYLVDIYSGHNPEHNIGLYSSYLSFFPTISSGPINKPFETIKQIKDDKSFKYEEGIKSIRLILLGLFEKMIVADNISAYIDPVFENPYQYKGLVLVAVAVLFSIQIYADFSGYSLIARGIASLFGIKVNINFDKPYFSTTIKEFWSKWHISLSNWLKEYVYIPLGGNRCNKFRSYLNLIITFVISGIWHGTSITFVLWGLMHGILSVIERIFNIKQIDKKYSIKWWLRCLLLNLILCISWVLFRANTIENALYIINPINWLQGIQNPINYVFAVIIDLKLNRYLIIELVAVIIVLFVVDYINQEEDVFKLINKNKTIVKLIIYSFIILMILALKSTKGVSFIYDQF